MNDQNQVFEFLTLCSEARWQFGVQFEVLSLLSAKLHQCTSHVGALNNMVLDVQTPTRLQFEVVFVTAGLLSGVVLPCLCASEDCRCAKAFDK